MTNLQWFLVVLGLIVLVVIVVVVVGPSTGTTVPTGGAPLGQARLPGPTAGSWSTGITAA